jgi:hypothetical protein
MESKYTSELNGKDNQIKIIELKLSKNKENYQNEIKK